MSTDQVSAENALICEKLLGFKKHCDEPDCHDWRTADGIRYWNNPTFTTWADAGLILEALAADGISYDLSHTQTEDGLPFGMVIWLPKRHMVDADSLPVAIRTAALKYIKAVKSCA